MILLNSTSLGFTRAEVEAMMDYYWELKFLKKADDRETKLKEVREQIKRYETDEKFLYKYIILGSKDGVEIVDENE